MSTEPTTPESAGDNDVQQRLSQLERDVEDIKEAVDEIQEVLNLDVLASQLEGEIIDGASVQSAVLQVQHDVEELKDEVHDPYEDLGNVERRVEAIARNHHEWRDDRDWLCTQSKTRQSANGAKYKIPGLTQRLREELGNEKLQGNQVETAMQRYASDRSDVWFEDRGQNGKYLKWRGGD